VHVDFSVIPALVRLLLGANTRDDIVEFLNVFIECFCV